MTCRCGRAPPLRKAEPGIGRRGLPQSCCFFSATKRPTHDLFSNVLFRSFRSSMSKEDLFAETKLFGEVSEEVAKNTLLNAMMEPDPDLSETSVKSKDESSSR